MASVLDLVKHYQQGIEKHSNDEERVLRCIDKLYQLKVTTQHLQETGVGRTVNALRKEPGDVGKAARSLVYKWKLMVAAEESDQEGDQKTDTTKQNGHSSGKESDDNTQSRSSKYDQYRNENPSPRINTEYPKEKNGHHSGCKRKYHSSEEEEPNSKKTRNSSSSEDDKRKVVIKQEKISDKESEDDSESSDSDRNSEDSESSREEIKIKQEIKQEDYVKKEIKTEPPESHKSSSSKYNDHHQESSFKHSHETEKRDHERSKSKDSSRHSSETKSSSHKHKSSEDKNKHERTDKKHKSDHKTKEEKKESKSTKSSSEKHRSSSQKHEVNSDQHKNDSDKNGSDKHSSKSDKHRSSSHSKREKESDKHKSSDRDIKQRSKESSSSREKQSSSNKEKSKERTSASKEKSSHSSEKKSSSDSKSSEKSRQDKKHEKSKDKSSSSHRSKSNSSSKEEVPKKKSKQDGENSDDGIDCGSGASFAEALGMISPAKPKKKTYKDLSPNINDLSPAALLAPTAKLAPLPALEISALPEISPNYRPRPPPKLLPHFTEEEAISAGISSKNQRTKVYSGNKVVGKVTSLYEMCVHVLQEHIDALEYTGGVPYEILKPVVDRATPQQLFVLEHYNPYLMEDTDHLWQGFCERSFRNKKRQEMETWREMYMRCQEEQECKLKSLTANIKMTQEAKKAPIKQTKMAYVDSVVKPPRNIARKQALHGTAHAAAASPAARVASLASAPNVLKGGVRPTPTAAISSTSFKPKKAPLMQKALQFMRGRKR